MSNGIVLAVDDDSSVRTTIVGTLEDVGWRVIGAASMAEAIKLLEQHQFDVAILDLRLDEADDSNQDGLLLLHRIKKASPTTAVIMLSAYATVDATLAALSPPEAGGDAPALAFLLKSDPYWDEKLLTYVERAFRYTQQARESSGAKVIRKLIQDGETAAIEFKSSLMWNIHQQSADRQLRIVVAKTLAGFLNGEGGILLIGVADNGEVLGIEQDLSLLRKGSIDEYRLLLTDILQSYLGLDTASLLNVTFERLDQKTVCKIKIQASPEPVFLRFGDGTEFWLRTGNSTRKLDAMTMNNYIRKTFPRPST